MSDTRARIADTLREHRMCSSLEQGLYCDCGWTFCTDKGAADVLSQHEAHVTEELLSLTWRLAAARVPA